MNKPTYNVMSMKEINTLPWNGLKVVSTFSGCGGSCTGYRMAGFKVVWANEFIPAAQNTYRANMEPDCILDCRDIRIIDPVDVLSATGSVAGEIDILDGSPPCASFSTSGKREKAWGTVKKYSDTTQRTDDLFFEYIRLLRGIQPKTFVAENVSGLVKGTAKGYFLEILKALKDSGYRVKCKLLDAQWLGVPQARQRTIFVGVREDLNIDPVHPEPLLYRYSVRDALCECNNDNAKHETDISRFAIGLEWDKLKQGQQSSRYFNLQKADIEYPSPTICASHGNLSTAGVVHATEKRKFTIAELKRICAFPDDFVITGSYAQQWERLGRSVPPVMMCAIASEIRDKVLFKCKKTM
jgi:DNA (cytosine-5)-methyltransferase 1